MARRFFKGANAGYFGRTQDGKCIRDYFMVKVETDKRSRFFQVREYRGIKLFNMWIEVKPFTRTFWIEKEGRYRSETIWKFDGRELSQEEMELRYEVVEVTNLLDEVSKLYLLDGLVHSPYVSVVKCLEICYTKDEMSRENEEDKIIIQAVEDYIKRKRKENLR